MSAKVAMRSSRTAAPYSEYLSIFRATLTRRRSLAVFSRPMRVVVWSSGTARQSAAVFSVRRHRPTGEVRFRGSGRRRSVGSGTSYKCYDLPDPASGARRARETRPHMRAMFKKNANHYFHSVLKLGKIGYSAINDGSLRLMLLS